MRPVAEYLREVIRLRGELADIVFTGNSLDNLDVTVTAGTTVKYNTHRDPRTGRRACMLINHGAAPADAAVTFAGTKRPLRLYRPFAAPLPIEPGVTFSIPGERLAVIVED